MITRRKKITRKQFKEPTKSKSKEHDSTNNDWGIDLSNTRKMIIKNRDTHFRVEVRQHTDHPYYEDECELRYTQTGNLWQAIHWNEREAREVVNTLAKHYRWKMKLRQIER